VAALKLRALAQGADADARICRLAGREDAPRPIENAGWRAGGRTAMMRR
jgi:hypothetical protein